MADRSNEYLGKLASAITEAYGNNLVSCAVFGSVARGTATPESDVDVLVVAANLPDGRLARVGQFEAVERSMCNEHGCEAMLLSPIIKSREEASRGGPLFWDMVDHVIILYDRDDFLKALLRSTRTALERNGARKVCRGNAWYWVLKDSFSPGEVFQI